MQLETLPCYPLAQLPTPIQSPPALTRALGGPALLIKRDDQTGRYGSLLLRRVEVKEQP
jgi:1-aminocyclopropane-1-carboxylate deaminase/D-cysteine desulfhydrase-like pyridoxal-dependent ACC family enzyme